MIWQLNNKTNFLLGKVAQGRISDTVRVFCKIQRLVAMYANFNGRSEHHEVGIFTLMKFSKEFGFIRNGEDACRFTRN